MGFFDPFVVRCEGIRPSILNHTSGKYKKREKKRREYMKRSITIIVLFFCLFSNLFAKGIYDIKLAANPSKFYASQIKLDTTNDTISGFVGLTNGFYVTTTGYWDNYLPLSGELKLRHANSLDLRSDLILTSSTWLTIGSSPYDIAFFRGNGGSIVLNGPLTIPANRTLHIASDTIINGQDNQLLVDANAQIFVDDNVTLTLRNLVLKDRQHALTVPPVRLASHRSKLALDNVVLAPGRDFLFQQGQFFVHNDVQFTGTSAFIYQSPVPSWITSGSCLYFDKGTTFSVAPATFTDAPYTLKNTYTDCNFIKMADKNSQLYLNGCSLMTTYTGLRLTQGTVTCDNQVNFDSKATNSLDSYATLYASKTDIGTYIWPIAISPDGQFIAVGRSNTGANLSVYKRSGTSLTLVGLAVTTGVNIETLDWSQDGRFIAVGGVTGKGFAVYSFNGSSTPTIVGSTVTTDGVTGVHWSPDGKYIAVACYDEKYVRIYSFDGIGKPTLVYTSSSIGVNGTSVDWSRDGKFIAFTSWDNIYIFRFNGSTLTQIGNYIDPDFGGIRSVRWSPDNRFISVASGDNLSVNAAIYRFDGTSTPTIVGASIKAARSAMTNRWSPDGRYIAYGGTITNATTGTVQIYQFDGISRPRKITPIITNSGASMSGIEWSPDSNFIIAGKNNTSTTEGIYVYRIGYINTKQTQSLRNSIVFGDSVKGAAYDVDVNILNGAEIKLTGTMYYDCVS
jgi:WD40 repeat protein